MHFVCCCSCFADRAAYTFAGRVAIDGAAMAVIDGPAPAPRRRANREQTEADLSPDGKWRAIVRDNNVVLRDNVTGAETPLTRDGTAADAYDGRPYWSPDSQHLVVMRVVPAQEHKIYMVESSPKDQEQPKLHSIDYLKPGDRIAHPRPRLFDIAAHREIATKEDLFLNPWDIDEVVWEPDGKRFTFVYNQRGHQVMRLVAVEAATGEAHAVINEQTKTFIDWTNKVFLHRLDKTREAIWMSERDGWNHLYLYDTAAGSVKNQITRGEWVVRGDFYKVGVADCGCHDNRMDKIWWNEQWMGWPVGPYYAEQSNVTLAPKLQGKLLLMVGEMDTNVDPASTMQVVNALIKADKDFDLLVVPGANHGVVGTPYGRRREQDFLVQHLLGVHPRADKPESPRTLSRN